MDAWEVVKENVLPRKGGRDTNKVVEAFSASSIASRESDRARFEEGIRACSDASSALDAWRKYIKWVGDAYPARGAGSQMVETLERASRAFLNEASLHNDERYMKVWVAYADLLADPSDVFTFLHARHIGDFLTMFYTAWAWTAEARRNYALADSVYCKGLRIGAQPREPLAQRYKAFQRRMTKLWLKHSELGAAASGGGAVGAQSMDLQALTRSGGVAPTLENDDTVQRTALQRVSAPIGGGGGAQSAGTWCPPAKRNSSALSVFTDEEFTDSAAAGGGGGMPPPRVPLLDGLRVAALATESERRRENTARATGSVAAIAAGPAAAPFATSAPSFGVFVEPEFVDEAPAHPPVPAASRSFAVAGGGKAGAKAPTAEVFAFDIALLLRDGREVCFEEVRAALRPAPSPARAGRDESCDMDVDCDSGDGAPAAEPVPRLLARDSPRARLPISPVRSPASSTSRVSGGGARVSGGGARVSGGGARGASPAAARPSVERRATPPAALWSRRPAAAAAPRSVGEDATVHTREAIDALGAIFDGSPRLPPASGAPRGVASAGRPPVFPAARAAQPPPQPAPFTVFVDDDASVSIPRAAVAPPAAQFFVFQDDEPAPAPVQRAAATSYMTGAAVAECDENAPPKGAAMPAALQAPRPEALLVDIPQAFDGGDAFYVSDEDDAAEAGAGGVGDGGMQIPMGAGGGGEETRTFAIARPVGDSDRTAVISDFQALFGDDSTAQ